MKKNLLTIAVVLMSSLVCSTASAGGPVKINKCKTIKKSGSYVVMKNLRATVKRGGDCIIINADYVTLDLNGFTLTGLENDTGYGVWDNGTANRGATIKNGTVKGFYQGVDLSTSYNTTIEKIGAYENSVNGFSVGIASIIIDNKCANNGWNGIYAQRGSLVKGNITQDNDGVGFWIECPSIMINNISHTNVTNGYYYSGVGCSISNNL